jgi:hypothetical protein
MKAAQLVFELVDAEIERIDMELCRDDLRNEGRIGNVERQLLLEVRRRLAEEAHGRFVHDADLDPGQAPQA